MSEDIEKSFSENNWHTHPLDADQLASRISELEGDITTLYFSYAALSRHHQGEERIAHFLKQLPRAFERKGIEMVTPIEAVKKHRKIDIKDLGSNSTARYGMHSLVGDHIQNLYLQELIAIGHDLEDVTDSPEYEDLKRIYGYLQQTDIMQDMNPANLKTAYERAINNYSILSDLRRNILEAGK
jgi:alpha-amylase